jgi:branched-chain amino acid transport system ATP-binding protein
MTSSPPLFQTSGLSKRFGGLRALAAVDAIQRRGELLGLIGPNGSGKSTFVNVVSGALPSDEGKVWLEGRQVSGLPQHIVARAGIARTFQAVRIFRELSVLDNVLAGLLGHRIPSSEANARAHGAMERVGLSVKPDTIAGRLGLFDQRRLEFAMRLIARPRLLMLDEPVGGLNPEEIRSMITLISSLRDECGILIIEHTMKVITSLADRVMVLVNGKKLIDDRPAVVLRDRAVIETYLGA